MMNHKWDYYTPELTYFFQERREDQVIEEHVAIQGNPLEPYFLVWEGIHKED